MGQMKVFMTLMIAGCLVAGSIGIPAQAAEKWPAKPLDLSIPTSPGSGASAYTQTIAKLGGKYLGKPIDVLNKPGGNGNDLCSYLARQPADGYSLAVYVGSMAGYMNMPGSQAKPTDFLYLMQMMKTLYTIYVHVDSPFQTIQALIKYAKENPGKLDIGSNKLGACTFQRLRRSPRLPVSRSTTFPTRETAAP